MPIGCGLTLEITQLLIQAATVCGKWALSAEREMNLQEKVSRAALRTELAERSKNGQQAAATSEEWWHLVT